MPIDDILIEEIENGTRELTDELFYQLIGESPDYLATVPFLLKIKHWQHQLEWPELIEARDNVQINRKEVKNKIRKIGSALLKQFDDRGNRSTPTWEEQDMALVFQHERIIGRLEKERILERSKECSSLKQKRELFDKTFPDWVEFNPFIEKSRNNTSSMAEFILQKMICIPPQTLRSCLKSGRFE